MVRWLVSLLGGFRLPLPAPCPMEFAGMPEHFVEDMLDTLLLASSMHHALDTIALVRHRHTHAPILPAPGYGSLGMNSAALHHASVHHATDIPPGRPQAHPSHSHSIHQLL